MILKSPNENPYYSIKRQFVTNERIKVIKIIELLPLGKFLFTHESKPFTTNTID